MSNKGNILMAVLNWGLGHATRSIPIIKALENFGFTPIIASDGLALLLLQKEFPNITFIELPSYNITYAKRGSFMKFKLLGQLPRIIKVIQQEQRQTQDIIKEYHIQGIISDNRYGVYSSTVPSVFVLHQLNIQAGVFSGIINKVHQQFLNKFDSIWVPDIKGVDNFTGKLSYSNRKNVHYIGILSRFVLKSFPIEYDIMILLSGLEPQRSILERKLLQELRHTEYKIVMVRGVVELEQKIVQQDNILVYNYADKQQLENLIGKSGLIISRSGYTTIMDMALMQKRVFFVPTSGQTEQEYLARRMQKQGIALYANQNKFSIEQIKEAIFYTGFVKEVRKPDWEVLFKIFEQ